MATSTHQSRLALREDAHIVIAGGGPAGSFFAYHAMRLANELGRRVAITICDGKNFARQGPKGCNMCAGVISGPLAAQLDALGFHLPLGRVQHQIDGYCFQTESGAFQVDHPSGKRAIRTVFRGNGPRFAAAPAGNISFDDFLLDRVKAAGVAMVARPVHDIILPKGPGEPVVVLAGDERSPTRLEADLVVGAFGLNTALLEKVRALGFGYRPPVSRRVAQSELWLGRDWIERRLGNRIVVLGLRFGSVRLGVLTPKGEHVTVTLLGREDVKAGDLEAFLKHPRVRDYLPDGWQVPHDFCHCFPRLGITPARRPYTDRLVLVGDANCSRYYKNGIESALVTARLAVETAFLRGVAAEDFAVGYDRPVSKLIVRDNRYGRVLFLIQRMMARYPLVAEAQQRVADDHHSHTARALRRIIWDVLTGDQPYREVFRRICDPRLVGRLGIAIAMICIARLRAGLRPSGRGSQPRGTVGRESGLGCEKRGT